MEFSVDLIDLFFILIMLLIGQKKKKNREWLKTA